MKAISVVARLLLSVATVAGAEEKIFSSDALDSEKGFRHVVESCFPDLEFGCYYFAGGVFFAVLEDFDRHRVMLIPAALNGSPRITRNGTKVDLPLKQVFKVKLAGASLHPEGPVETPEHPIDFRIGWWLPLEATDRLVVEIALEHPLTGIFRVAYDPDTKWTINAQFTDPTENTTLPADAYEISRRSLLQRVLEILGKQNSCTVRLRNGITVLVGRELPDPEPEYEPLYIHIGADKVSVGPPEKSRSLTGAELRDHLTTYSVLAQAAEAVPKVAIQTDGNASDALFRQTLSAVAEITGVRVVPLTSEM